MKNSTSLRDWEKEFDERFNGKFGIGNWNQSWSDDVKSFISQNFIPRSEVEAVAKQEFWRGYDTGVDKQLPQEVLSPKEANELFETPNY